MVSVTDVANVALAEMGENPLTNVMTEQTKSARELRSVLNMKRRAFLRNGKWKFASTRASLAADASPPDFGYTNRYALPGDLLRLQFVSQPDVRWRIEGTYILADWDGALDIVYTRDVEQFGSWDPDACDAFALVWAAATARTITGSDSIAAELNQKVKDAGLDAKALDAADQSAQVYDNDLWLRARSRRWGGWAR